MTHQFVALVVLDKGIEVSELVAKRTAVQTLKLAELHILPGIQGADELTSERYEVSIEAVLHDGGQIANCCLRLAACAVVISACSSVLSLLLHDRALDLDCGPAIEGGARRG